MGLSLVGPPPSTEPYPVPELPLSQAQLWALETRIRLLLVRWQPMTDSPEGVVLDLYRLVDWLLDGESPPTCPLLMDPREAQAVARGRQTDPPPPAPAPSCR